jgi:glycine/D-amino acid oxidase-like deaminating enzyme/bacterioferritin-associated ferredoxin
LGEEPTGGARRLGGGTAEPAGEEITFAFEGRTVHARAGESLAASLTAAGLMGLRQAGPDEQRGVFCGMGVCQECLVQIEGFGGQRACMVKTEPGMSVYRHDPALAALRPLGSRPAAAPEIESVEVAIIGAGPAGLSAAKLLAEAGIAPVVIDERPFAGGQYFKPLAPSQRFLPHGEDEQFSAGRRLVEATRTAGSDIRSGEAVWHASADAEGVELGIHAPGRAYVLKARFVILATGAYERPWHIPGWTLPGVMTTGAAQTLARSYRVAPGTRVLVAGNGPLNWQVALEIAAGGGKVVGIIESGTPSRTANAPAFLGMLAADRKLALRGLSIRRKLDRAGIPIHEGARLVAVTGNGKAERAIAAASDGREFAFDVDAVCLGYGFLPSTGLLRMLGCPVEVDPATGFARPFLNDDGRAGTGPVFVAGDASGIGGSVVAANGGIIAAASVLDALGRSNGKAARATRAAQSRRARARRFQHHLWQLFADRLPPLPIADEVPICRCENVTAGAIRALRDEGVRDLGSLKRRTRLGMGGCQGRYCAGEALKILRDGDLASAVPADLFAPQAPEKPVPAILLESEKAEWGGHREVETRPHPPHLPPPDPLPATTDLLVIGAGVIGTSTAMFAAGAGIETVVIDRAAPNSQASGGNAGSLHVQLLSWDFGRKAMAGGSPALNTIPLQRDAVQLWKALERELGGDFEITTTGGLMVAENEEQTAFLRDKAEAERSMGIPVEVITRDEIAALAPHIAERMVVAAYCPDEGKINPMKATPALVAEAKRRGARFAAGHNVIGIRAEADGYEVTTSAATIRARRVVIAAGGWSRHIGRMVGVELPISGAPLQMLVTEPTRPILKQLVAHADRHLTMKQATNGNLIIGGAWTAGTDAATGYAKVLRPSIEGNLWVAERTVPALAGLHLLRSWAAMNVNIDGAPLLGAIPGKPGLFVAASANGYTLGPLLGQLTADCIAGRQPSHALDRFTLARFGAASA